MRCPSARFLGLSLIAALAVGSITPAVASTPAGPIPVLGTFTFDDFGKASGVPVVGAVHAVTRLHNATGVYYSVGVTRGQGEFTAGLLSPSFAPYKPSDAAHVTLVDSANLTAYKPLASERGLVSDVRFARAPAERLVVMYSVFPALPAEVAQVDLQFEFGATVTNVPVTTETLGPVLPEQTTILGEGWPAFPTADLIAAAYPQAVSFDLRSRSVDTSGASAAEESATEVAVTLNADFFFAPGSAVLADQAAATIADLAAQIGARGTGEVTITGHTDSVPEKVIGNQKLSDARAAAVGTALAQLTGPDARITTTGRADAEPVADNSSESGRAKNRRVTVTFEVKDS